MYDIALRPDVMNDIRKEIDTVLKETDGVMTTAALFNMKLLDSFMRESQRFSPAFTGEQILLVLPCFCVIIDLGML